MTPNTSPKENHTLTYYTWPLIVSGMLTSVVCAGIYTIIIATKTPAELIVESPYEKGLEFEKTLQQRARAQNEKLIVNHDIVKSDRGLSFLITLQQGISASDNDIRSIHASFIRPSDKHLDFEVELEKQNESTYSAHLPEYQSGLWYVDVKVEHGNGQPSSYHYELRFP